MAIRKKKKLYKYNDGGKLITYDTIKGDRRSFTGDQRKDAYINDQILTGNFGYDESTGGLIRLDNPINISEETKDYTQLGQKLQLTNQWQREAVDSAPPTDLVQSYIDGTNQSKEARDAYILKGYENAMFNSPFNTIAYMTPAGMAAGAIQGAANLGPDLYNFAKDPSWSGAGAVGMDALMMLPAVPGTIKGVKNQSAIYKEADDYLKIYQDNILGRGTRGTDQMLNQLKYNMSDEAKAIVDKAIKTAPQDNRFLRLAKDEANLYKEYGKFDRPFSPQVEWLKHNIDDIENFQPGFSSKYRKHPSGMDDFYTRQTPTGKLNFYSDKFKNLSLNPFKQKSAFNVRTGQDYNPGLLNRVRGNNILHPYIEQVRAPAFRGGKNPMTGKPYTLMDKIKAVPSLFSQMKAAGAFNLKGILKSREAFNSSYTPEGGPTNWFKDMGGLSLFKHKPQNKLEAKKMLDDFNHLQLSGNQKPAQTLDEMYQMLERKVVSGTITDLRKGNRYKESSISTDSQPILINQLTRNADVIPQYSGLSHTMNTAGKNWFNKRWLKDKYGKTQKDVDALVAKRQQIGTVKFDKTQPDWFKDYRKSAVGSNTFTAGSLDVNSFSGPWWDAAKKDWVSFHNKVLKHQKNLAAKSNNPNFKEIQNIPEAKLADGNLFVPQVIFEKAGGTAAQQAARIKPVEALKDQVKRTAAITIGAPTAGYGSYKLGEYIGEKALEQKTGGKIMKYNKGGMYSRTPKYKKGGFLKGLKDFGLAAANTLAAPVEGMLGTDFGISENYQTGFGKTIGAIGETAGNVTGQIGKQALNTVVPGGSLIADAAGATLEAAGVTTDPSMVGVSTPPPVNTAQNKFVNNNPASSGFAKHGTMNYKYKTGGMLRNADIEAEGGELVLTQGGKPRMLEGGVANKIADNAFELTGKSHNQGGEKMVMPNGESIVISNKYAKEMKSILKSLENAKKNANSSDKFVRNAANRNVQRFAAQASSLINKQQSENGNKTNTVARYGGQYMKAKNGMVSQTPPKTGPKTYHEYLGGMTEEGLIGLDYERNLNDPNLQLYTRPPLMDYAYQKYMDDLTRMKSPEAVAREYDKKGDSFMAGRYRKYTGRGVPFINQKDGGRIMKAQDGLMNLNPNTPAYDYFSSQQPMGPYSTMEGRMYSGNQSFPGLDVGSNERPFDRQMGYRGQQGDQVMYPRFEGVDPYGMPAAQGQGQGQTNLPQTGEQGAAQVPNMGSVPGANTFNQMNPQFDPNKYNTEVPNMGTVPGANMFNEQYGPNPNQFNQGQGDTPIQMSAPNLEIGDSEEDEGQSYPGIYNEEIQQGFGVDPGYDGSFTLPQQDESFGVMMDDQNPAPVMGPENMPEGYGDTAAAEEYFNTMGKPGDWQDQNQVTQDPVNDPNNPGLMSRLGEGLGKVAPYASSLYNIGMGISGMINPPKGLNAGDYMAEQVQGPKALDAQAMLAPQMQMASTYMSQTADPRRKQMFASRMAPQTSSMYAKVNQINDRNRLLTDRTNSQIGLRNKQMQLKVDNYNRNLAAQPMNFLKQGIGQGVNAYLGQQNYNLMAGLSDTANYSRGQYMPS